MDVDRAKAVADVARVIVDSAKVEVDFLRVTGADKGSGFLPTADTGTSVPSPRRVPELADRPVRRPA